MMNLLSSFDLFPFQFHPLFSGKPTFSSLPSVLSSFFTIALFLFLFFSSDFIQKKNPKILNQVNSLQINPNTQVTKQNFPFMLSISNDNGLPIYDPSLFTFSAYQIKYRRTNMNNILDFKIIYYQKLAIGICDINDFSLNFPMLVSNYPFICIKNRTLDIEGDIDQENISEILILASFCSNKTSNITCQGKEEQAKFLKYPRKTANMLFLDFNEEIENFENPTVEVVSYESFELTYEKQTKGLMYLKKSIFQSISGIDGSRDQYVERLKKDEIKYQFASLVPFDEAFFFFSIHPSKKIEKITRTYQTFSEALAGVLGIINMVIFLWNIVMSKINRFFFKMDVLNNLFDFAGISSIIQKKEEKILAGKTFGNSSKKKREVEKIHLSLFEVGIFWVKSWLGFKMTQRERMHASMEKVFVRETSLYHMLMRQQQIERICLMLFNHKKRRLLESKPIFPMEKKKVNSGIKGEEKKGEGENKKGEGGEKKATEQELARASGNSIKGEEKRKGGGEEEVSKEKNMIAGIPEITRKEGVIEMKKNSEEINLEKSRRSDDDVLIELMEFEAEGRGSTAYFNRDRFHTVL